jgi:hypothetical protein
MEIIQSEESQAGALGRKFSQPLPRFCGEITSVQQVLPRIKEYTQGQLQETLYQFRMKQVPALPQFWGQDSLSKGKSNERVGGSCAPVF